MFGRDSKKKTFFQTNIAKNVRARSAVGGFGSLAVLSQAIRVAIKELAFCSIYNSQFVERIDICSVRESSPKQQRPIIKSIPNTGLVSLFKRKSF